MMATMLYTKRVMTIEYFLLYYDVLGRPNVFLYNNFYELFFFFYLVKFSLLLLLDVKSFSFFNQSSNNEIESELTS